jgi:Ca-activated chloride channel family protein
MFRFENIDYLYLLSAIPLFVIIYITSRYIRKRKLKALADKDLLDQLIPEVSSFKPLYKLVLLMFAYAFGVIALANPQIGTKMEEVKREGVELIIALDVSNSMKAEDIKPNRLDRAKQSILRLIDNLVSDKIGIIVFAGDAFLQLPITTDYSAAKLMISTVETDMVGTQGTAIGAAIDLAVDSFSDDEEVNKALIIITDGENHEDDALGSAEDATDKGIIIHTIGMGSIEGSPIPIYRNGREIGYVKDKQGNTVVSKLNAGMLQQIAAQGDGRFIRSSSADPDLTLLLEEISGLDKKEFEAKMFTEYEDRFQYFLAAALLFLIIELLISNRKNKYLARLISFAGGKK